VKSDNAPGEDDGVCSAQAGSTVSDMRGGYCWARPWPSDTPPGDGWTVERQVSGRQATVSNLTGRNVLEGRWARAVRPGEALDLRLEDVD